METDSKEDGADTNDHSKGGGGCILAQQCKAANVPPSSAKGQHVLTKAAVADTLYLPLKVHYC